MASFIITSFGDQIRQAFTTGGEDVEPGLVDAIDEILVRHERSRQIYVKFRSDAGATGRGVVDRLQSDMNSLSGSLRAALENEYVFPLIASKWSARTDLPTLRDLIEELSRIPLLPLEAGVPESRSGRRPTRQLFEVPLVGELDALLRSLRRNYSKTERYRRLGDILQCAFEIEWTSSDISKRLSEYRKRPEAGHRS